MDSSSDKIEAQNTIDRLGRTRWTVVVEAQAGSTMALEELVSIYRTPIVRHLTRHLGSNDGEDAAQEYLVGLMNTGYLKKASSEHGKFRAFLLHDLRYFILGWKRSKSAAKRGGKTPRLSYELLVEEGVQIEEQEGEWTTEPFDQDWTLAIMKAVKDDLELQWRNRGEWERFKELEQFIDLGGDGPEYERAAEKLGMTVNAVRVAVSRMRSSFAARLKKLVAESLAPGESVDDELDYLRRCYLGMIRNEKGEPRSS